MELTAEQIDRWVSELNPGSYQILLKEGDSIPSSSIRLRGPAVVSVTVYRTGGWSAAARGTWSPEEIAR